MSNQPQQGIDRRGQQERSLFDGDLVRSALVDSVKMLDPRRMARNPVMFVAEIGAAVTTVVIVESLFNDRGNTLFYVLLAIVLWLTVLFANFAEALAEARGKAQANALRGTRKETQAKLKDGRLVSSNDLKVGDEVYVEAGETIPADGEVIDGVASVNEAAITGESAPVIREAGGDRSGVTGGTTVLSDKILVRVTAATGDSFLDRMIALVEGAQRQKTPNEIALTIVLSGFTLAFLIVVATLQPIGTFFGIALSVPVLVALLVCLIPTTIGGLLPAIGIAGMDQALRANLLAKSGKAVELAGDVDTLLLDKTGTITIGNRQARRFTPVGVGDVDEKELAAAAAASSLGDSTPEGKSIVDLGREILGHIPDLPGDATIVPFSAQTRMSGVDMVDGTRLRKGAGDATKNYVQEHGGTVPAGLDGVTEDVARAGGTPLVVIKHDANQPPRVLGVVALEDVLKPGIRDRFERLRAMGLRTVMVTGDNPLTAEAIAKQAGVDDFIAEATPEDKLAYIKKEQQGGRLVAMMGDGTNDAPALAQADLGVAMNAGTQAAKEAANMVDLDSDPTKLIEVIEIGKKLLMTRGALTTFSVANDVAKYFAIIPAMFVLALPQLAALDIMGLGSPESAILSAVIFNAIVIPLLVPIALKGVTYRPIGADALLRRNLLIYGVGGLIVPFVGIKLIDLGVDLIGLA